eukprot:365321-Chlamydomonas_euryale.AAC.17
MTWQLTAKIHYVWKSQRNSYNTGWRSWDDNTNAHWGVYSGLHSASGRCNLFLPHPGSHEQVRMRMRAHANCITLTIRKGCRTRLHEAGGCIRLELDGRAGDQVRVQE